MRYKVLSRDNHELAEFNNVQSVVDHLFTLLDEEIKCLYVLDTNVEGFCFSTYKRTPEALTGTMYKTRIDAIGN